MSSWPHNRQKPPRQDVAGQPIPVFFSTLLAVIGHVPGTPTSIQGQGQGHPGSITFSRATRECEEAKLMSKPPLIVER